MLACLVGIETDDGGVGGGVVSVDGGCRRLVLRGPSRVGTEMVAQVFVEVRALGEGYVDTAEMWTGLVDDVGKVKIESLAVGELEKVFRIAHASGWATSENQSGGRDWRRGQWRIRGPWACGRRRDASRGVGNRGRGWRLRRKRRRRRGHLPVVGRGPRTHVRAPSGDGDGVCRVGDVSEWRRERMKGGGGVGRAEEVEEEAEQACEREEGGRRECRWRS